MSISFKTYSYYWTLFGTHSLIVAVALPQKFRCPLEWPLRTKKNTHFQHIQWKIQCHKCCVKLVLKHCDDLLYIKIL